MSFSHCRAPQTAPAKPRTAKMHFPYWEQKQIVRIGFFQVGGSEGFPSRTLNPREPPTGQLCLQASNICAFAMSFIHSMTISPCTSIFVNPTSKWRSPGAWTFAVRGQSVRGLIFTFSAHVVVVCTSTRR